MRLKFWKRNESVKQRAIPSEFVLYHNENLGFSFEHPKGWLKKSNHVLTVYPPDATMVSSSSLDIPELGEMVASPCITVLISSGKKRENLSQFYTKYLSEQSKHFDRYKLRWEHPYRIVSGEPAHEWSFEFSLSPISTYRFISVFIMVTKNIETSNTNMTYLLDGTCLESQFEGLEPTLLRIIRSLSLSPRE